MDLSSREFYPLRTVAGMVMAQNQGSYSRESLFRNHSRDNEIDPFALEIWPLGQRSNVINGSTTLLRLPGSLQTPDISTLNCGSCSDRAHALNVNTDHLTEMR